MNEIYQTNVPGLGNVIFQKHLSIGQMLRAYDYSSVVDKSERADFFTNYVVSCMITEPKKTPEEVAAFDSEVLNLVIQPIVEILKFRNEFENTDANQPIRDRFYKAYQDEMDVAAGNLNGAIANSIKANKALDQIQAQIKDSHLVEGFSDAIGKLRAVNLKVSIPDLSGLNLLAKEDPEVFRATKALLNEYSRLGEMANKEIAQMAKLAKDTSIPKLIGDIDRLRLPESYLNDAMSISGLNSPIIHSPTYTPVHPIQKKPATPEETSRERLVDAYDILSHLEPSLRNLIETELRKGYGEKWWKQGVPEPVRNGCEERKSKKEKPSEPTYHPIYYAYVNDYLDIIKRRDNWKNIFSKVFGNAIELEACFTWVGKSRDPIAHNRPITDMDFMMFTAGAKWLQVRIEEYFKTSP